MHRHQVIVTSIPVPVDTTWVSPAYSVSGMAPFELSLLTYSPHGALGLSCSVDILYVMLPDVPTDNTGCWFSSGLSSTATMMLCICFGEDEKKKRNSRQRD